MASKYTILRVKRKREDEALESVLVEYEASQGKKTKPNLADVLDSLTVGNREEKTDDTKETEPSSRGQCSSSGKPSGENSNVDSVDSKLANDNVNKKDSTKEDTSAIKLFTRLSTFRGGEVANSESCSLVLEQIESMKTMKRMARTMSGVKSRKDAKAAREAVHKKMKEKAAVARSDVIRRRRLEHTEGDQDKDAFSGKFLVKDFVVREGEDDKSDEPPTVVCNGEAMTREKVERDDDYVYDIYIMAELAGEEDAMRDPDAVVRMETFDESLLLVDDDDWKDEYDYGGEDEDSNDENYQYNDYPEDEDSSYDGEGMHDEYLAYNNGGFGSGYNRRPTLSSEDEEMFHDGHDRKPGLREYAYEPEYEDDDFYPSYNG